MHACRLFELALTMCNQVATGSVDMTGLPADAQALFEDRIAEECLKLLINCLKFDFIGACVGAPPLLPILQLLLLLRPRACTMIAITICRQSRPTFRCIV